MRTSILKMAAVCCGGLLLIAGCGGEEPQGEERTDLEQLEGKADIPSWISHIPADWGCDQTLTGKFKGWDSAHMYSFPGKVGYEYTFAFQATYPKSLGAVVAVYDSGTGKRVAFKRNRWDNQATVVYKAAKSIKYLVAAYSVMPYATGSYTFHAACKLVAMTCQDDLACAKTEFCKFAAGDCGKQNLGVCTARPQFCTEQYAPVCGCDGNTYGNACFADSAGVSIAAQGECKPLASCQQAGGYCTYFLTKCNAGFVDGPPMDCPLGKSGKCCLPEPKIKLATDKSGYMVGEAITAELVNGGAESIFVGGCSVLSWEKEENGVWVSKGPSKICVWEGIAAEVKAGTTLTETLSQGQEGTFRLVAGYGLGCTPGKPLSQAACKSTGTARSEAFKIKSCPMLSMPNPNAFCPGGKIVPKYDTDGICITGYACLPCEVKDCGPQPGMPNTLCPDGKTVSGPTGKCLPTGWGTCAWEIIECPAPKCQITGCSGQICADKEVITTCEFMPWYGCFKLSECGTFGPGGSCGWKQTPAYLSCMAQYGK
jgi:eight-cysteine-cluster-containing protein